MDENEHYSNLVLANRKLTAQSEALSSVTAQLASSEAVVKQQLLDSNLQDKELVEMRSSIKKLQAIRLGYHKGLERINHFISHQVRSPICQLIGVSNLLKSQKNSQEEVKEMVGFIKVSANRLNNFTNQLTGLVARISKGKIKQ